MQDLTIEPIDLNNAIRVFIEFVQIVIVISLIFMFIYGLHWFLLGNKLLGCWEFGTPRTKPGYKILKEKLKRNGKQKTF